jgi:hypothetical protein
METGEVDKAIELFTEDCTAQPMFTDQIRFHGKPKVGALLSAVRSAGELKYVDQRYSPDTIVLLVDITFSDITLEAAEVLRIDEDGRCREIASFGRPYMEVIVFSGRICLAFARQAGGFLPRLLTGLIVWPLEITQRIGLPLGMGLMNSWLDAIVRRQASEAGGGR